MAGRLSATLLLSGRCNQACDYCYQTVRRCAEKMAWATARAAMDFALQGGSDVATVELSGGEPLLQSQLLVRCLRYLHRRPCGDRPVRVLLTTNGTLLTDEVLRTLDTHHVTLQLSLGGLTSSKLEGDQGTCGTVDRLLDNIGRSFPNLFERMRVHVAAVPPRFLHLADSVAHLLSHGVREVCLYPVLGRDGLWQASETLLLEKEMRRLVEGSVIHWQKTGMVPLRFLRATRSRPSRRLEGGPVCAAAGGEGFCVDPDGRAWSCPMFAGSLRRLTPLAEEASRVADLGDVRDPKFGERLATLPARAREVRLLTGGPDKHSSYARCSDCPFLGECALCPAASCSVPGDPDPDRVSDFLCAFTRCAIESRERFRVLTGGGRQEQQIAAILCALRELREALSTK